MNSESPILEYEHRIFLVEDDVRLATLIEEYMLQQNIEVVLEHRGDKALQRILDITPDMVILDIMLPGLDGLEICKQLRPKFSGPILMLTAKNDDIDQVLGLELGADDYLVKPVQPRVLLARIKALLRRWPSSNTALNPKVDEQISKDQLSFGQLKINTASQEVWFMNHKIDFTTNEFGLLWLLASNAGKILSRDDILNSMRGVEYDGLDRSVDVRISKLRKKLKDDPNNAFRIKTVWGKGYLFIKDAWE